MERFKHIKETQRKDLLDAQTEAGEGSPAQQVSINRVVSKDEISEQEFDDGIEVRDEVKEYLDSFNEEELYDIFSEYYRRAGSNDLVMNWIPFRNIKILDSKTNIGEISNSSYGSYSISKGIVLNSDVLFGKPEVALWTVIHEECHAISKGGMLTKSLNITDNDVGWTISANSGVNKVVTEKSKGVLSEHTYYSEINEGITELLTERIYREYKRRTGPGKDFDVAYSDRASDSTSSETERTIAEAKFDGYKREWQNTKMYIGIISAVTDVPEDVVENAVFRTYIRNGTILTLHDRESEIVTMLNEVHPTLSRVLDQILNSKIKDGPSSSLSYFVDVLDYENYPDEIPREIVKKIVTALQEIRDEWGDAYKIVPGNI